MPHRLWKSLLPLASFFNFSDFIIHRPLDYTRSRAITAVVSVLYHGVYGYFTYRRFGLMFTLITMAVFVPHVGFYLDRARQFMEHNLMPLDNRNGARSFGIGFWGLLIGGGPWGQPCHWVHHLAPSIPWYQQIALHRHIRRLLTKRQREQFLLTPVIGFPRLLWRTLRDANAFARERGIRGGAAVEPVRD
jgi:fatty acid desaturase